MTGARLVRATLDACETALVRHGFRRLRRHDVVFDISSDFLGWVGLNYGSHSTQVRINPFIGIHCVPLMRLVEELSGQSYQLGRYATFAVHLGEICPEVDTFDFSTEADLELESERLATTLRRYAVPFMEENASYAALLPILIDRVPTLGGYPQRLAVALYLMGRYEEARQFVLGRRAEYEAEEAVRESFDRFALPFLKLLTN